MTKEVKVHLSMPNKYYTVCGIYYGWEHKDSKVKWTGEWKLVTCKRCLQSRHPAARHQRALAA